MSRFQGPPVRRYALLAHLNNLVVKKRHRWQNKQCVVLITLNKCKFSQSSVCEIKCQSQHAGIVRVQACDSIIFLLKSGMNAPGKSFSLVLSLMNMNEIHMCFKFVCRFAWSTWANGRLAGERAVVVKSAKALCVKTRRGFVLCAES